MNNIFENAYFGKMYKTKGGKKALYITTRNFDKIGELIDVEVEDDGRGIRVFPNGKLHSINMCKHDECESNLDIVSEWEEETNVDELAFNYAIKDVPKKDEVTVRLIEQAFKAGYYTAKNINE